MRKRIVRKGHRNWIKIEEKNQEKEQMKKYSGSGKMFRRDHA